MYLIQYPFVIDAGGSPPELVDRDRLRQVARLWLKHLHAGRPAKTLVLISLPGACKTNIRDPMVQIRVARQRPLPALFASPLRLTFSGLNRFAQRLKPLADSVIAPMPVTKNIPAWSSYNFEQTLYGNGNLTQPCGQIASTTVTQDTISADEMEGEANPNPAALTNSILLRQWVTAC